MKVTKGETKTTRPIKKTAENECVYEAPGFGRGANVHIMPYPNRGKSLAPSKRVASARKK